MPQRSGPRPLQALAGRRIASPRHRRRILRQVAEVKSHGQNRSCEQNDAERRRPWPRAQGRRQHWKNAAKESADRERQRNRQYEERYTEVTGPSSGDRDRTRYAKALRDDHVDSKCCDKEHPSTSCAAQLVIEPRPLFPRIPRSEGYRTKSSPWKGS